MYNLTCKKIGRTMEGNRRAEFHKADRIYLFPTGESMIDQLVTRNFRPIAEWRKLLPRIFAELGIPEGTKARWSQRAGCSCPCSPGFILDLWTREDFFVDVELVADAEVTL